MIGLVLGPAELSPWSDLEDDFSLRRLAKGSDMVCYMCICKGGGETNGVLHGGEPMVVPHKISVTSDNECRRREENLAKANCGFPPRAAGRGRVGVGIARHSRRLELPV